MNDWLQQLDPPRREQVVMFAALVLLAIVAATLWFSLTAPRAELLAQVQQRAETLRYINTVAPRIRAKAQRPERNDVLIGSSLLAEIDASARAGGLTDALSRVEPEGDDRVRVWLDNVAFDAAARWLEALYQEHSITVREASVDRIGGAPGRVNMRLTLANP